MGEEQAPKKERPTVIFRPAPPREPEPAGMRMLGCAAVLLLAAVAYAGAVAWFAHRERVEADAAVRKIPSLALASFGARCEGGAGDVDPAQAGLEMRSILEERLKRLKGKSLASSVAVAAAWEPLKADPREGFVAVPAGTRVLDLHDPSTCVALRAMHGTDWFLRVLATFGPTTDRGQGGAVRLEVAVFGKDAKLLWSEILTEPWPGTPAPGGGIDPNTARMLQLRTAMFRAADRVGDALEYGGGAK